MASRLVSSDTTSLRRRRFDWEWEQEIRRCDSFSIALLEREILRTMALDLKVKLRTQSVVSTVFLEISYSGCTYMVEMRVAVIVVIRNTPLDSGWDPQCSTLRNESFGLKPQWQHYPYGFGILGAKLQCILSPFLLLLPLPGGEGRCIPSAPRKPPRRVA